MSTPKVSDGRVPWWARGPWPVCALALGLRGLMVAWAWSRVPPTADGRFYHVVAQRLASGDGYTWLWPDGVVTFAAHYPVGYPALMAPVYGVFGPVPGLIMVVNALIGTVLVRCVYDLSVDLLAPAQSGLDVRIAATGAAFLAAMSPTLVAYTPALMTEGAVACLLMLATRVCIGEPRKLFSRGLVVALLVGAATLLRPQSILFAPVFGALLGRNSVRTALVGGALVLVMAGLCTAPWVARNCEKMGHCSFVSANGGWNLLIGTFPEGNGAWVALEGERVPEACREVFEEAAKDVCFKEAGLARIVGDFPAWLSLTPAKLRATFDYGAAAGGHLNEAGALHGAPLAWLKAAEVAWQRLLVLLAGAGAWIAVSRGGYASRLPTLLVLLALVVGALGGGAWWACALVCVLWLSKPTTLLQPAVAYAVSAVLATLAVHGVFFGAARYSLPAYVGLLPLAAPALLLLSNLGRKAGLRFVSRDFDTSASEER